MNQIQFLGHDIARRRAGPDSREISLEATYLRFLVGVDATNHATSLVYLRQFFACPSHEGTVESSFRVAIAAKCRLQRKGVIAKIRSVSTSPSRSQTQGKRA